LDHLPPRPNGFNSAVEDNLEAMFPPLHPPPHPLISEAITIVDNQGIILCWYLPRCLSRGRQVGAFQARCSRQGLTQVPKVIIWNASEELQPFFRGGKKDGSWRNLDIFYKPQEECMSSSPGQVLFSPGWFEQAHDVSIILFLSPLLMISPNSRDPMTTSNPR
jgi:hypothetical protein